MCMNKTMKQMADELCIDKQKVYRFINRECIVEVSQQGKTKYYDETAQTRIIEHFKANDVTSRNTSEVNQTDYITLLMKQIETLENDKEWLQSQVAERDKTISDLTETIKSQAQSINAREHNELAETMQKALPEQTEKKQGFWARVFRKERQTDEQ